MESISYPQPWNDRVGGFATLVGKTIEEVSEALKSVVGEPGDEALAILSDLKAVPDADLKEALKGLGIPSGKFNMNLVKLRGEAVQKGSNGNGSATAKQLSILPDAPDEDSFLVMLRTGGVSKVDTTEVISAVKAAFAQFVGLYAVPQKILDKMEEFSLKQEEPSGEDFFEMQRLLTEKKYGDVLAVLKVPGNYVSEGRKKDFLTKVQARLWPALKSFQNQLSAWQDSWMKGAGNQAMVMMALAAGQAGGQLPPGVMAPPDTSPLHTASEEVADEINRIFAGPGIPIARALAYDANRIMGILKKDTLPAQIGVATKEQMLKDLGINVGSDIVRIERSVVRYTLAVMSLSKVVADEEVNYLSALIQLGATIPWDKFEKGAGIGSRQL